MLRMLIVTIASCVFVVAFVLPTGDANAFSEPIPTKSALIKPGKLLKLVSKGLFTLPTTVEGGSFTVSVEGESGTLTCDLADGTWKGLGNPTGSKGWKYVNRSAPDNDPCKIVILKEKVVKVLSKGTGGPEGLPSPTGDSYPDVSMKLTVGEAVYCALATAPHFKVKAERLIKMNDQAAPALCGICGDSIVNQESEECDGSDDTACPGLCLPQGDSNECRCPICGDDSVNRVSEQCDGTDAPDCPGLCHVNCICPLPICNNGVKEVGEVCDPAGSTVDCPPGEICGGFCTCVPEVACACGSPDPSMYLFTDKAPIPDSICGTTDGSDLTDVKCMGLYMGGGGTDDYTLTLPLVVPDQGTTKFNIAQCVGTDITLAHTTRAQVSNRHCSEGRKCVGGTNDGEPCIRNHDCELGMCRARCWFGSYLSTFSRENPSISSCAGLEILQDAVGGVDCSTGKSFTRLPLEASIYATGIDTGQVFMGDQSPSTPGYNPCPICVGGTLDVAESGLCEGGLNDGLPCMPMSTSYDLYDCCESGPNASDACTHDTDCPGSTCVPGCTMHPTSLDCPPEPSVYIDGILLTLKLTTETDSATAEANGNVCGWCRDIEVEGSGCFEGDPDSVNPAEPTEPRGCPDSTVITCLPATFHGPGGGDWADLAECDDALPCRTDADCQAPYETCTQRNPGAFGDASVTNISYQGSRPGDLRDHSPHPATVVTSFCIPPSLDVTKDLTADLGGPGGLSLVGEARLSPSAAFMETTSGLLD